MPATGLNLEQYSPAITLMGPTIDRRTPDFFPLNLLPNLPFVLNHGDLTSEYRLKNTGKIFLETTTEQVVEQVGLFGQQDRRIFSESFKAFLVPEQFSEETSDVISTDSVDQLLGIGVYRFTVTAAGKMGDQIETKASSQQTLIIFPWKQCFLFLVLLVVFRRRIARAFNWAADLGKSFVDFRNSRKPTTTLQPRLIQEPRLIQQPRLSVELATIQVPRLNVMPTPSHEPKLNLELSPNLEPKPSLNSRLSSITARALAKIRSIELKPIKKATPRVLPEASKVIPAQPRSTIRTSAPANRSYSSTPTPPGFEVRPMYPYWYQPPKKSN
jgi:hypothetical protein